MFIIVTIIILFLFLIYKLFIILIRGGINKNDIRGGVKNLVQTTSKDNKKSSFIKKSREINNGGASFSNAINCGYIKEKGETLYEEQFEYYNNLCNIFSDTYNLPDINILIVHDFYFGYTVDHNMHDMDYYLNLYSRTNVNANIVYWYKTDKFGKPIRTYNEQSIRNYNIEKYRRSTTFRCFDIEKIYDWMNNRSILLDFYKSQLMLNEILIKINEFFININTCHESLNKIEKEKDYLKKEKVIFFEKFYKTISDIIDHITKIDINLLDINKLMENKYKELEDTVRTVNTDTKNMLELINKHKDETLEDFYIIQEIDFPTNIEQSINSIKFIFYTLNDICKGYNTDHLIIYINELTNNEDKLSILPKEYDIIINTSCVEFINNKFNNFRNMVSMLKNENSILIQKGFTIFLNEDNENIKKIAVNPTIGMISVLKEINSRFFIHYANTTKEEFVVVMSINDIHLSKQKLNDMVIEAIEVEIKENDEIIYRTDGKFNDFIIKTSIPIEEEKNLINLKSLLKQIADSFNAERFIELDKLLNMEDYDKFVNITNIIKSYDDIDKKIHIYGKIQRRLENIVSYNSDTQEVPLKKQYWDNISNEIKNSENFLTEDEYNNYYKMCLELNIILGNILNQDEFTIRNFSWLIGRFISFEDIKNESDFNILLKLTTYLKSSNVIYDLEQAFRDDSKFEITKNDELSKLKNYYRYYKNNMYPDNYIKISIRNVENMLESIERTYDITHIFDKESSILLYDFVYYKDYNKLYELKQFIDVFYKQFIEENTNNNIL